jgi:hypothetical protein
MAKSSLLSKYKRGERAAPVNRLTNCAACAVGPRINIKRAVKRGKPFGQKKFVGGSCP